ncbi:MAG: dTDP-4-dehydrorhamnose 3,5-epimerase family protein [Rhodothermus sp.]|nr:dTDP-4-dehydrorhamnose 3,5-epimerase family protein [Rhodothermus sp.]
MNWKEGPIEGVIVRPLKRYEDTRGWLAEFFRQDELDPSVYPVMGYVSLTHPGITRGPHEHREQTDLFVFFHGRLRMYLWDARSDSPTYGYRQVLDVGEAHPVTVLVPPGVVHAYRNIGDRPALLVNCPNRLYAGWGRQEPVDEIRHENRPDHPFHMD